MKASKSPAPLPSIYIEAQVYAGGYINDVARDMCAAAERTGLCIIADFNGHELQARPGDCEADVAAKLDAVRCQWVIGDGSTECGAPAKLRHRGSRLCFCGDHGLLLTVRAGMMLEPLGRRVR